MSNNKEFNLPETRVKSKLNDIWTEVQTNLPSINFDDEDENGTENEVFIRTLKKSKKKIC